MRRVWATKRRRVVARARGATPDELIARAGADAAHQGVVRRGRSATRTSTRRELLAAPTPLVVALDEVQDPQNLGAICRTAEVRGRDRAW